MKRIEFEGKIHEFPDDFTDSDIESALGSLSPEMSNQIPANITGTGDELFAAINKTKAPSAPIIAPPNLDFSSQLANASAFNQKPVQENTYVNPDENLARAKSRAIDKIQNEEPNFDFSSQLTNASAFNQKPVQENTYVNPDENLARARAIAKKQNDDSGVLNRGSDYQAQLKQPEFDVLKDKGREYLDRVNEQSLFASVGFSPEGFVDDKTGTSRGVTAPIGDVVNQIRNYSVGLPRMLLTGVEEYYGKKVANAEEAAKQSELVKSAEIKDEKARELLMKMSPEDRQKSFLKMANGETIGSEKTKEEIQAQNASKLLNQVAAIPAGIAAEPWEFIENMADPIGYLAGAGLGNLRAFAVTAKTGRQFALIAQAQKALKAAESSRIGRGALSFGENVAGNAPFDIAQGQAGFQDISNPANFAPTVAFSAIGGGVAAARRANPGAPELPEARTLGNQPGTDLEAKIQPSMDLLDATLDKRFDAPKTNPEPQIETGPRPDVDGGNFQPATMPEAVETGEAVNAEPSPARAPDLTPEQATGRQEWESVLRSFYAPEMADAALQVVDQSVSNGAMPADVFTRAKVQIRQGTPTIIEDGKPVQKIIPVDEVDDVETISPMSGNWSPESDVNLGAPEMDQPDVRAPEMQSPEIDLPPVQPVPMRELRKEFQKRFTSAKRDSVDVQDGLLPVIKSIGKIKLTEDVRRQFGLMGQSLKKVRDDFGDLFTSEQDVNGKTLTHMSDALNELIISGQVRSKYGAIDEQNLVDIIGYDEYNKGSRNDFDLEQRFNESVFTGEVDNFKTNPIAAKSLPQYFTSGGEVYARTGKVGNDGFIKFKDSANRTYQFPGDQPIHVDEVQGRAQVIKPFETASPIESMNQNGLDSRIDDNDSSNLDAFAQSRQPGEAGSTEPNRAFIKIGRDRIRKLEQVDLFGGRGLVAHNTAIPKSKRVDDLEGTALFRAADEAQTAKAMEGQQSLFQIDRTNLPDMNADLQTVNPSLRKNIAMIWASAEQNKNMNSHIKIGRVEPVLSDMVRQQIGINIENADQRLTVSDVHHAQGRHGVGNEIEPMQIPITSETAQLIPSVLKQPSFVEKGGIVNGEQSLKIGKHYKDGTIVLIDGIINTGKQNHLEIKTFYQWNPRLADIEERGRSLGGATGFTAGSPEPRSMSRETPNLTPMKKSKGTFPNDSSNLSQRGGEVKGQTVFDASKNSAVVELFQGKADLSTFLHEYSHLLRRWALQAEDQVVVQRWLEREGLVVTNENGSWTRAAEERFARGFERYLREGWAADGALKEVFEKIKGWMREIYLTVRGTELDGTIPEDVRKVYDRLLGLEQRQKFNQDGKISGPEKLSQKDHFSEADPNWQDRFEMFTPEMLDDELIGTRKAEELAKEKARDAKFKEIDPNAKNWRNKPSPVSADPAKVGPQNWPEGMERFNNMKARDPLGMDGVVTRKPLNAIKESGFLTRAERFYTNFVNQARPMEILQKLFEKDQGRPLTIKEDLKYAVNRVMGAGGTANVYIDKHFAPIFRGGELRLWDGSRVKLDRLSPHEQRLLDKYLIAKDSYWRSENNPEYENPMLNPQEARDWLTAHDNLPESLRNKLEARAQYVWQYYSDLATKKTEVGIWTNDEFTKFTKNPFYIPELRDWNAVLAANLDAKAKKQFTTTNKLIRGTNSDEWAPIFDPVTAAVAETHLLVSEAAKLGVMHRIIDMAEKSQDVGNWVQPVDANYQPGATEAIVKVLRPRETVLPPHLKVRADTIQQLRKNLKSLETDESEEALKRQRERIKSKLTRTMQGNISKDKLANSLERVEAQRQKYRNQKRKEYTESLEAEEKILRLLPGAQQRTIEQWFKEGDIRTYVVPREIGEAINGLAPQELGPIEKIVVPFASLFRRAQVGYNPDFTLANAPRDYQEGFFNTGMASPKWALRGLTHFLKQDEYFERYMRAGGAMGGNEAGFRKAANRADSVRYGDRVLADRFNKFKDKHAFINETITLKGKEISVSELARISEGMKQVVMTPFELSETLNEIIEMATRLGIFDYMTEKGMSDSEAAHAGRHGTLDFGRVGAKIKGWNQMIPFLNASIQGMDRMVRAWKENPKASALRFAMMSVVPTMALLAWNSMNPHYAEIPGQEKEYYWILMKPNGSGYLKIAKGHLTKLAVNPLQMIAENKLGTAHKNYWRIAAGTLALAIPISDAAGGIPQPIQEILEQSVNFDIFFEKDIVRDPNLPAGFQADPNTAETLKAIGKALNISPARMQHALQSALGGTSTNVLWALDFALGKTKILPNAKIPIENRPFVKRVFGVTQSWKSDLLREHKLALAELRQAQAGLKTAARKGTGPNAMDKESLKELTSAQQKEVKEASERVLTITNAIKKNEPLQKALAAREQEEAQTK